MHWYQEAVFYHIYTFGLCKAPFENDYAKSAKKLGEIGKWIPHIKNLGCSSVLFSPVMLSRTHGYDVTDYYKIDNRLGTNDDFRALVDKLHENGLRVVLDSVFNHCGRDFFAFRELREGNRSYASWFSGVDFGRNSSLGDCFTYDTWSGYDELVKFNLRNPETKAYLLDAALFAIREFGIDGMRLDSANVLDFDFMRELRKVTTGAKEDFWLMGEVVSGDYSRWVNDGLLHSVTNYQLFKALFSSHNDSNLYELAHTLGRGFGDGGIWNHLPLYNFVDNHDQPRLASVVKRPEYLRTIYLMLYTLPGLPSIYYGSEWGTKGVKAKDSDQPLRPYFDIDQLTKEIPRLEGFLRKLADLRAESPALKWGAYREVSIGYMAPFVFERRYGGETVTVAIHPFETSASVDLSRCGSCFRDVLNEEELSGGVVAFAPYSGRILKQRKG
jgi:glycosidase